MLENDRMVIESRMPQQQQYTSLEDFTGVPGSSKQQTMTLRVKKIPFTYHKKQAVITFGEDISEFVNQSKRKKLEVDTVKRANDMLKKEIDVLKRKLELAKFQNADAFSEIRSPDIPEDGGKQGAGAGLSLSKTSSFRSGRGGAFPPTPMRKRTSQQGRSSPAFQ